MKSTKLLSLFLVLFFTVSASAQLKLNVSGDAEIQGRLNVSSGGNNMFIGADAGEATTTGQYNTFIGQFTGIANLQGGSNTFIGYASGFSNKNGNENTFLGAGAGLANSSGNWNTFVGMNAGRSNTSGGANTFLGLNAGYTNSTGGGNTFLGQNAGYTNTTGYSNTFLGPYAGFSNTTGYENTFLGSFAGDSNTTGRANTFLGRAAGSFNTTGNSNTFLGFDSGFLNTTGGSNTFLGRLAGTGNTSGNELTALGYAAGPIACCNLTGNNPISNAFTIGGQSLITTSHSGVLGNISLLKIGGYVNWGTASDGRMKTAVQEDVKGLDFILQLRPVSYQLDAIKLDRFLRKGMDTVYRAKDRNEAEKAADAKRKETYDRYLREKSKIRYTGFIAQEVEQAAAQAEFEFSGVVKPDHAQDHYSLRYAEFVVPLVKATQELADQVSEQQELIEKQEKEQLAQQHKIEQLQTEVTELKMLFQQMLADRQDQTPVQLYQLESKPQARLSQNYPNPFHEDTLIDYTIPAATQNARLEIHSVDGKLLKTIPIQNTGAGRINIRAGSYPAGTYLYSLLLDGKVVGTKKMVLTQ